MAQFSLPQNSKIEVGNYFKDKTNSKNIRKIKLEAFKTIHYNELKRFWGCITKEIRMGGLS